MRVAVLVLVFVLVGCGSQSRTVRSGKDSAAGVKRVVKDRGRMPGPACSFYAVTVAVGLLEQHAVPAAKLRSAAGRRGWKRLITEAHRSTRLFEHAGEYQAVAVGYRQLVARLDAAYAGLARSDLTAYRRELRAARGPLKSVEAAADRTSLGCTIVSSDGSSTLTFGKG